MRYLSRCSGLLAAGLVLCMAVTTQAALFNRGLYDNGSGVFVNLIYDDHIDATWLGDANFAKTSGVVASGEMNWTDANNWAAGLTMGTFDDWRLPTTANPDGNCSSPGGPFGFGCTGSEMGHLFNVEGITSATPGLFTNLPAIGAESLYWSSSDNTGFGTSFAFFLRFRKRPAERTSQRLHELRLGCS